MIPILYQPEETDFQTNGVGMLSGAISCYVNRELNGIDELELQYPVNGQHFRRLRSRMLILAKPNPYTRPQPYRIYRMTKPMSGIVAVYARHVAYDLMGIPVAPFRAGSASEAMQQIKANAAVACPFSFWTDIVSGVTLNVAAPKSIWRLLGGSAGSLLDTYGGEYDFDRWTVGLRKRLGKNRGVSIRYGKNLTSLEQDENCAGCYTGVYPYWANDDGMLVQLDEKIINAEGNFGYTRIHDLDLSMEFEEPPSKAQLRARAEAYMRDNDIGVPEISLTLSFVQLDKIDEYRDKALLEEIYLGDTVSVIFDQMGINASARAVETRYNVLLDRFESVTIGRVKANIADTIVKQKQQLDELPSVKQLTSAVDHATNWIVNGKGYMVAVKDEYGNWKEIVSLDTPNLDAAVNVWRWNNGGFGHSNSGYDGPYETAITQDGQIVANFITAGSLTASIIKAGILKSLDNDTFYLDLENGILKMNATELSVAGKTMDQIANAAVDAQTQEDVWNKLTNNGQAKGLYIFDGEVYINASYIASGVLNAALIAAGVLQSKDDGKSFRLDLDTGVFSSAKFYSNDENAYITIENGELILYAKASEEGEFVDIARIGYTEDSEGDDYPYIIMGSTNSEDKDFSKLGLYKMFRNGLWIGNSAPRYSTGSFVGLVGASGIFVDTLHATAYVVNGEDMEELYHGTVDATFA